MRIDILSQTEGVRWYKLPRSNEHPGHEERMRYYERMAREWDRLDALAQAEETARAEADRNKRAHDRKRVQMILNILRARGVNVNEADEDLEKAELADDLETKVRYAMFGLLHSRSTQQNPYIRFAHAIVGSSGPIRNAEALLEWAALQHEEDSAVE